MGGCATIPHCCSFRSLRQARGLGTQTLQGDDPTEAAEWLEQIARVRPGAGRLARSLALGETLANGAFAPSLGLAVGELVPPSVAASALWCALPESAGDPGGHVSIVAEVVRAEPDAATTVGGLAIDSWSELVPAKNADTGLALQHPAPDAPALRKYCCSRCLRVGPV